MSAQENKATVRHIVKEMNKGNGAPFWEILAPNCVIHDQSGRPLTVQEFGQGMEELVRAYPDFQVVIEDLIAKEDKVVIRYTESGTWTESYMGMEATGKGFTNPAIEIWRFADGKVVEMWMARDLLTVLTQTGVIPPME
jgi:steroid delta-isomerase-like uncharacterized protein